MNVKDEIATLNFQIKTLRDRKKFLQDYRHTLKKLPEAHFCGNTLDFDRLPHKEVIRVIRTLGGKWKKSETLGGSEVAGRIDYQTSIGPQPVRCWAGEPPPTCRLVEVEEEVPAQVIPAHTRKVRKLICTGKAEPLIVALARANAPQ